MLVCQFLANMSVGGIFMVLETLEKTMALERTLFC